MRRGITIAIAIAALVAPLAACATNTDAPQPALSIPPRDPDLLTSGTATVLDDGDGAELCLGMIQQSYPPQCGGPALIGWDWASVDGSFEEASDVRWGRYEVDGYYDAELGTFQVVTTRVAVEGDPLGSPGGFGTPCEAPSGGWRVQDDSRVSEADKFAALELAPTLDGYAGSWVDDSRNPAATRAPEDYEDPLDWELAMSDPRHTVINVRVTGEAPRVERQLRAVWSGMLCVSIGDRSEKELIRIQDELTDTPGLLMVAVNGIRGAVEVHVVHDDGSLQERVDERYGAGVVEVASALTPAGS